MGLWEVLVWNNFRLMSLARWSSAETTRRPMAR